MLKISDSSVMLSVYKTRGQAMMKALGHNIVSNVFQFYEIIQSVGNADYV